MATTEYSRDLYDRYTRRKVSRLRQSYQDGSRYVIVAKGHHETSFYDAATPEACFASCLLLLREYHDGGWLFDPERRPPVPPVMTPDLIQQFPECEARRVAQREWDTYEKLQANYHETTLRRGWVQDTLTSQDGEMAYVVLGDICHPYEDPGFRLEPLRGGTCANEDQIAPNST